MILINDKKQIMRLLDKLSHTSSTDVIIAFIADNNGMLESCRKVSEHFHGGEKETNDWFENVCGKHGITVLNIIREIDQILELFQSNKAEDKYLVLGLDSSASLDEVKKAYRKLSVKYHPDIVGDGSKYKTDKFVAITTAYHNIIDKPQQNGQADFTPSSASQWRYQSEKPTPRAHRKKYIFWTCCIVLVLILSSLLISRQYNKRVMLSTLQYSNTAFVPPAAKKREKGERTFSERLALKESTPPPTVTLEKNTISKQKVSKKEAPGQDAIKKQVVVEKVDIIPIQRPEIAAPIHTDQKQPVVATPKVSNKSGSTVAKSNNKPGTELSKIEINPENRTELIKDKQKITIVADVVGEKQSNKLTGLEKKEQEVEKNPNSIEQNDQRVARANSDIKEEVPKTKNEPATEITSKNPDTLKRIEEFVENYTAAYEDKNLLKFIRYFEPEATENGVAIENSITAYKELFDSTKKILLSISVLKWTKESDMIDLSGRFKIELTYTDWNVVRGHGKISFLIKDDDTQMSVKELSYEFDK